MMQSDPRNWQVLKQGSCRQREAFEILSQTRIFSVLAEFDPAHIGTIANDIDIESSDIDIVCSPAELGRCLELVTSYYGEWKGFSAHRRQKECRDALVVTIPTDIPIEIFAEQIPTAKQQGFRHYMVAYRLLELGGDYLRVQIRQLKRQGLKTEPAFARCLGLEGDPYRSLLLLEAESDSQLKRRLENAVPDCFSVGG